MSDISIKLGKQIRNIRHSKGISQEKLAEIANLNVSFIGQIERGVKKPTVETIEKIVNALDISFYELFSFKEIKDKSLNSSITDKIVFEIAHLPLKEQEAVYKIVKQVLQIKDI